MAHPTHQYPPRAFSSPQPTYATHPGAYPPPAKRPRLSPNPQSPYSSPNMTNGALPNQVFSSPYPPSQPNGVAPHAQYEPSPPPTGTMGPPSRPVDKPTDMTELADVLVGSGVDLKEEEAALVNRFNSSNHQQNGFMPTSNSATSFNSPGPHRPALNPYLAHGGFDTLSRNVPGSRDSFYGAGTFNQPAIPYKSAEEQAEEARKKFLRHKLERQQHHLNDPFLFGSTLNKNLFKHANAAHVEVPDKGLLTRQPHLPPLQIAVAGPDKHEVLTVIKGQDLLYTDVLLSDILTLISLATQERLRVIVENTATLAKGRKTSSHGIVPPELADIAIGQGIPETVTALSTPGNPAVSSTTNPLKRTFSAFDELPSQTMDDAKIPSVTLAFPNQLVQSIRRASQAERSVEDERKAKREKRATNGILSGDGSIASLGPTGIPGSSTTGLLGERAPDVDTKRSVSKKEQKRQAEVKATEAQQHAATNKTMNMALGLGGALFGKKLSWMTKDSPSVSNGFPVPSRASSNSQAQSRNLNGTSPGGSTGQTPSGKAFGEFREDNEFGAGIQMRDVIATLEPDPKESKTLARAYTKLASKK